MKLCCKNYYGYTESGITYEIIPGVCYDVQKIKDDIFNSDTERVVVKFYKTNGIIYIDTKISGLMGTFPLFSDYFYTNAEYRRIKLEKLDK